MLADHERGTTGTTLGLRISALAIASFAHDPAHPGIHPAVA